MVDMNRFPLDTDGKLNIIAENIRVMETRLNRIENILKLILLKLKADGK